MFKDTTDDTAEQVPEIERLLDELARQGARRMILAALELEVEQCVHALRHVRDEQGHAMVVRNGKSHHERTVNLGARPVGGWEATCQSKIVAADILGEEHAPAWFDAIPGVVFTEPEVGSVGMTKAEARAAGQDVVVAVKQLPATFAGIVHWLEQGIPKVVVARENRLLLGATVAGQQTGNMLGLLNITVHARLPLAKLRTMMYGFPAFYSGLGEGLGGYARVGVISVMGSRVRRLGGAEQDRWELHLAGPDEICGRSAGGTRTAGEGLRTCFQRFSKSVQSVPIIRSRHFRV